jgi:phosphoribosylamine--glycine ligase
MKILVIGGGGREHALVWKLSQSRRSPRIFCAPGNAGIAELAECVPLAATDVEGLVAFALERRMDFTVVGPEAPLCAGIVDAFRAARLRIFGPTQRAAQLEGSKIFAKQFLLRHHIPTARAEVFDDAAAARAFVRKHGAPLVVKADGLAAGKGAVVAASVQEAEEAIAAMMERRVFGVAGARVVVEECLRGEELSVMAFVDGKTVRLMEPVQDHKRAGDGDTGPMTGGMGAVSPTPFLDGATAGKVQEIFARTLSGLQAEGLEYRGVLYAGLMLTSEGPKVLEFNCRFGDPETQVLVPRMEFDLLEALEATAEGRLEMMQLRWSRQAAVCVVVAAGGYPGAFERGYRIEGLKQLEKLDKVSVFHAGTRREPGGEVLTDGGRVLGVTALGDDLPEAVGRVYEAVRLVRFAGAYYRRDIGARALRR